MEVRFWGIRGSIATPLTNEQLRDKMEACLRRAVDAGLNRIEDVPAFFRALPWEIRATAGGDTACIEVRTDTTLLVLDAGTGFRRLGLDLLKRAEGQPMEVNILMTHTHWDHISGIPFFTPAFNPANKLTFFIPNTETEEAIRRQQSPEYFPVPLPKAFRFVTVDKETDYRIGDLAIDMIQLYHPGGSYGYRVRHNGKSIVYATDSEYKDLSAEGLKPYYRFFKNADLLMFDAQYTMLENVEKEDWGHSNVFSGIDLALDANVKRLAFIHHDPTYDDAKLAEIIQKAEEYRDIVQQGRKLELYLASEGLCIPI